MLCIFISAHLRRNVLQQILGLPVSLSQESHRTPEIRKIWDTFRNGFQHPLFYVKLEFGGKLWFLLSTSTLLGTNMSRIGKRKIIFKSTFGRGYVSSQEGISNLFKLFQGADFLKSLQVPTEQPCEYTHVHASGCAEVNPANSNVCNRFQSTTWDP